MLRDDVIQFPDGAVAAYTVVQSPDSALVVPCFAATVSFTATGGSARMLTDGMTMSYLSGPSCFVARSASFSHAISTSPIPRSTNVVVDPRAPASSTGTFLYSFAMNARVAGSLPLFWRSA